jgi:peptidoglycan hydrolase CwlO-like protein
MWEGVLSDESEVIEESSATKGVGIMMLSEEFVAARVNAGDAQRAEHDRELVRRLREERAERRAERAAGRRARHAAAQAVAESVAAPAAAGSGTAQEHASVTAPEAANEDRRELAHAGR